MMTKETNLQRLEDEAALAGMEQAGTQLSDKGEFAAIETFAVKKKITRHSDQRSLLVLR